MNWSSRTSRDLINVLTDLYKRRSDAAALPRRDRYLAGIVMMLCILSLSSPLASAQAGGAAGNDAEIIRALQAAEEAIATGEALRAQKALVQATILDNKSGGAHGTQIALITATLAYSRGQYSKTEHILREMLVHESLGRSTKAVILNNLANVYLAEGKSRSAYNTYLEGLSLAESTNILATKARLNAASALRKMGEYKKARTFVEDSVKAMEATAELQNDADIVLALVYQIGALNEATGRHDLRALRYRLLESILTDDDSNNAQNIHEEHVLALILLADLYKEDARYEDALRLLQTATTQAESIGDDALALVALWHRARLYRLSGDAPAMSSAYTRAVKKAVSHAPLQTYLTDAGQDVPLEALYIESADAILRLFDATAAENGRENILRAARDMIEASQADALRRYYGDECVTQALAKPIDRLDDGETAILYPISLSDRLELIVQYRGRLTRVRVGTPHIAIENALIGLRTNLQLSASPLYRSSARALYRWLINPLEKGWGDKRPRTLVFVPNATIEMVPLAALYDGEHYLIERYAVATIPGLALTNSMRGPRNTTTMLVAGLSTGTTGFGKLPDVVEEVQALAKRYHAKVLLDKDFTKEGLRTAVQEQPYSTLHLATHGVFTGTAQETYLLSYDGKIAIDDIEVALTSGRYADTPVALLTMSACETAIGDKQAVLGLSGLAVKSGARTVLGSLWRVHDRATARLMARFYEALEKPNSTMATALQQAQQAMLNDPQYSHPGFWAPFVLIGNWR